ncbi:hypothetical protein ACP4OV_014980 [Aristida adscensionis]
MAASYHWVASSGCLILALLMAASWLSAAYEDPVHVVLDKVLGKGGHGGDKGDHNASDGKNVGDREKGDHPPLPPVSSYYPGHPSPSSPPPYYNKGNPTSPPPPPPSYNQGHSTTSPPPPPSYYQGHPTRSPPPPLPLYNHGYIPVLPFLPRIRASPPPPPSNNHGYPTPSPPPPPSYGQHY